MLREVLNEIKATSGSIDLNQLARKLNIDRPTLDGMIEFWVRKGKLQDIQKANDQALACFSGGGACGSCHPTSCAHTGQMPRSFTITLQ